MEVQIQKDISIEHVPFKCDHIIDNEDTEQLAQDIEALLLTRIENGDKNAYFPLGQYYFERENYERATLYFERSKSYDIQSVYQLGVIYYDGLGCKPKPMKGVKYLLEVAKSIEPRASNVIHAAQYNLGRACYQGVGVTRQSDSDAERWWLLAANDGDPKASIKAQSVLGLFYSGECNKDLKKAFFWHSEATGNGNLESQGALGAMYEYGLGIERNLNSAYVCLKEASERGNVYAMSLLISHYYRLKLFTKAAEHAFAVSQMSLEDSTFLAKKTDCLVHYINKGISIACFYYARCLHEGHGIKKDAVAASPYYSKSYLMDADCCAYHQDMVAHGLI